MSVLVGEQGQILRTSGGRDLTSSGPFQLSLSGRNTIATSSVPFGAYGTAGLTLLGGVTVSYAQLYRRQPWVAIAINKLTRQVASLPIKVYRRDSQGERERVHSHPLVDLIKQPVPGGSASQLKQWLILPALTHGNATLLKARSERYGPPTRLWPLDWRYMMPTIKHNRIVYWTTSEFGNRIPLDPATDLLHFKWEAVDGPLGVSPLEQLGVTIRIEQSAQEYQESYLRQGARPPSGISLPEGVVLDAPLRAEMRADIENVYAGSRNAGRPALLPGGAKWESIAHDAHEAELIAQRKLSREEVAGVYDIPPPLIGILDKATFSNISEQHKMLFTTILRPWLTLIEETFQAQVIDPEPAFQGLFVEFDLAEVLRGDKLREINALKIAVQSGLLTLNEARQIQNLPRYDAKWADKPLIPANNLRSAPEAERDEGSDDEKSDAAQARQLAATNGHHS